MFFKEMINLEKKMLKSLIHRIKKPIDINDVNIDKKNVTKKYFINIQEYGI